MTDGKIDASQIESVRFECLKDCGKCCFYELPMITSNDINRILNYLESLKKEDYNEFIYNWISSQGIILDVTENEIDQMKESLKEFWWPTSFMELKEEVIASNYTMYMMPSSGRCRFLDPLELTCFIHKVKPLTCRLFPFTANILENGTEVLVIVKEACPGLGKGNKVNVEEILKFHINYSNELKKDMMITLDFLIKRGIIKPKDEGNKIKITSSIKNEVEKANMELLKSYYMKTKKEKPPYKLIIEPLVEAGLIPQHPIFRVLNEQIKKEKNCVRV